MDNERKIHLSEGVPLKSECSTNIILNTGKHSKLHSVGGTGTVINLKSDNSAPHDVGLHINTTLSIAASKKIKLLFILNFMLSVICIIISCFIAFYYWNEMLVMRRQLEAIKDQMIAHNIKNLQNPTVNSQDQQQASPLVLTRPFIKQTSYEDRTRSADLARSLDTSNTGKKYYVEDLPEDLHFTNSKNKHSEPETKRNVSEFLKQDIVIAHFTGGGLERNLRKESAIGPWAPDYSSSTKDFGRTLELTEDKFVKVHEDGLYLVYAQVVYNMNTPNYFTMWAQNAVFPAKARLLTTCSTGDVMTTRSDRNSQISCSIQTVARLYNGDLINFAQREKNSTVNLKLGNSYFGFIKLSS